MPSIASYSHDAAIQEINQMSLVMTLVPVIMWMAFTRSCHLHQQSPPSVNRQSVPWWR